MASTGARRQAREMALQVLFQLEYAAGLDPLTALNGFREAVSAPEDAWRYAAHLLEGVQGQKTAVDELIQAHMAHWRLDRLALVDLNILRIAAFELRFGNEEVPAAVAINEAIEIAKKYGSSDSGKFVNGILDQIRKSAKS